MAAPLCCARHHHSLYQQQGGSRCETQSSKTRGWRWPNSTSLDVVSIGGFGTSSSCKDDEASSRALCGSIATRSWSVVVHGRLKVASRIRTLGGEQGVVGKDVSLDFYDKVKLLSAAGVSYRAGGFVEEFTVMTTSFSYRHVASGLAASSRSCCCTYTRELASCVSWAEPQQRCRGRSRRAGSLRFRVRAGAQENPLGEEGYWDQAEGKEKLDEIEDLKELLAEGERLQGAGMDGDENDNTKSPEQLAQERATKLREELERRAKEQAKQKKEAEIMFQMGQRAYGRGVYDKSVEILEAALTKIPRASNLGGEIQIWLAMAYEAHNRHDDCIALYKRLESGHPNKNIKRQAADLRYILEAPKLKISKDEMVSIPIIDKDYDRKAKSWSQTVRDRRRKPMKKSAATRDYLEDWLVWNPPRWERNPYFWVAVTIWLTLVGISLMFQN